MDKMICVHSREKADYGCEILINLNDINLIKDTSAGCDIKIKIPGGSYWYSVTESMNTIKKILSNYFLLI